jgi:hypothetical protein
MIAALMCEPVLGGSHIQAARVAASSLLSATDVEEAEATFRSQKPEAALEALPSVERGAFSYDAILEAAEAVGRAQAAVNALPQ